MPDKDSTPKEFPVDRILQFDSTNDVFIWILPKNERFILAIKKIKGAKWEKTHWTTPISTCRQSLRLAHGFNFTFAASVGRAYQKYILLFDRSKNDGCSVEVVDDHIIVKTPPPNDPRSEARLAELKLIDGRVWDKESRSWKIPITSVRQVRHWCEVFGINPAPLEDLPDFDPIREPLIEFVDGEFEISFPNDRDLRDAVGELPGVVHDQEKDVWRVDESAAEFVSEFAEEFNAQCDEESRGRFALDKPSRERLDASKALDAHLDIPLLMGKPAINDTFPLKGYQKAGIRYCLDVLGFELNDSKFWSRIPGTMNNGVLNADDMGLGKSVQSLAVLELTQSFPAVVVVPTSTRLKWLKEVEMWLPHRSVEVAMGTSPTPLTPNVDITIIGWKSFQASAEILIPKAVVFDEIHKAKNPQTQTAKSALALANNVRRNEGIVLGLSGTPALNRVAELQPILQILGRLDDFGGSKEFKKRFGTPGKNQVELSVKLRSTCMLRRTKRQALPQLGEKQNEPIFMYGDQDILEEYRSYRDGFKDEIRDIVGTDLNQEILQHTFDARKETFLPKFKKLQKIAATAKMAEISDFVTSKFIEPKVKLVIFAHHREIVEWAGMTFGDGCIVYGGLDDQKRNDAIRRFQTDPDQLVIACSIEAAGEGIDLTAASHVLFIEQSWNPGKQDQAADRCHRLGQLNEVTVYTALCVDTVDVPLFNFIQKKRSMTNEVFDGVSSTGDDSNLVRDLFFDMFDTNPMDSTEADDDPVTPKDRDEKIEKRPPISFDEYIESQPMPKGRKIDGVFLAAGDPYLHFSLDCSEMKPRTLTYRAMEFNEALRTRTPCKKCSPATRK